MKGLINIDPGNQEMGYRTPIDQINASGGIDRRTTVPVFVPVNPVGTAGAATTCTELTEDDGVLGAIGFFQAADTTCYLDDHGTPIIGTSLTTAQAAQAQVPWYNMISENDQVSKEMAYFKRNGVFTRQKVGVVSESVNLDEKSLVLTELKKLKVDVVQTAINSTPDTDNAALTEQYGIIAQKFRSVGVTEVVAVANSGNNRPRSEQQNQSAYLSRLVAVDYADLDAYVTNSAGHSNSVLKNAIMPEAFHLPALLGRTHR